MSKATNTPALTAGRPTARIAAKLALDDSPMKRVNFNVSPDTHARLKIYATRRGKSISEVLVEYVSQLPDAE